MSKSGPRTIEDVRRRERESFHAQGRPPATIHDPTADECAPLFTSRWPDCLTHVTRWITYFPEWTGRYHTFEAYEYAQGWCGVTMRCRQVALAESSGFACRTCLARCEELDLPTWSLIPDTGCAVSGGKRGLTLGQRRTP
jgi:hypothetical protein